MNLAKFGSVAASAKPQPQKFFRRSVFSIGSLATLRIGFICQLYSQAKYSEFQPTTCIIQFPDHHASQSHIDDFVESLRAVTPSGIMESRRFPGSGAGPSPDRMLDAAEAFTSGAGSGSQHVLIIGFESADYMLDPWMDRALECCRDFAGTVPAGSGATRSDDGASREGTAGAWRSAFLNAPYLRDTITEMGSISETFESAVTWDRFEEFHRRVTKTTSKVLREICGGGTVTCRFTHVYPDGPAPYFTVLAPSNRSRQLEQWNEIKAAVSDVLIDP